MKKEMFCSFIGIIGSGIATCFGGWNAALTTLLIFMIVDYLSGLIVAAVFHKSKKSENGTLKSAVGFEGLCKKGMTLLYILIAYRVDLMVGTSYIKDAVCIGFIVNELISIIENAGLMGITPPKALMNAIDILNSKEDEEIKSKDE